jgi:hypothetical protein
MVVERDNEFEPWPAETDPEAAAFAEAFAVLIGTVLSFTDDEAKRKAAIGVLIAAHRRVQQALAPERRLN